MSRLPLPNKVLIAFAMLLAIVIWQGGQMGSNSRAQGGCMPNCDCSGGTFTCGGNTSFPTQPPPPPPSDPQPTQPPGGGGGGDDDDGPQPVVTQPPPPTPEPTATPDPNATPTATPVHNECIREVCGGYSPFCPVPGTFLTHFTYDCDSGVYLYGSGNVGQLDDTCCSATPTAPPPPPATPEASCPDTFVVSSGWGQYNECGQGWKLTAEAKIPAYKVWYTPYPRGLVYQEMQFSGDANLGESGYSWSSSVDDWNPTKWEYDGSTTDINGNSHQEFRNFKIGARWRQVTPLSSINDAPPCWVMWSWDERPWGFPQEVCSIDAPGAVHTYETASAGKPENGPNDLPSYQVTAKTYWVLDWKWKWERYECVEKEEFCKATNDPDRDIECHDSGGRPGYLKTRCIRMDWRPNSTGGMCDLSQYGQAHPYVESNSISMPGGAPGNVLPVPVIEVQGIIQK